jgi:hypothetical protein
MEQVYFSPVTVEGFPSIVRRQHHALTHSARRVPDSPKSNPDFCRTRNQQRAPITPVTAVSGAFRIDIDGFLMITSRNSRSCGLIQLR